MRRWGVLVWCLCACGGGDDDGAGADGANADAAGADGAVLSVTVSADTTFGMAPLAVQLGADVTGGSGALTYGWDFGDGGTSSEAAPAHSFAAQGIFAVTVQVTDAAGGAGSGGVTIYAYDATNDPPVITVPGVQTVGESQTLSLSVGVVDPDAGPTPILALLELSQGTLSLAGTGGLTFVAGDGTDDATMSFTGSQADVTAAMTGMTFTAPAASGTGTLTITVDDQGATGEGGALVSSSAVTIDVTGVNSPPTISALDDVAIGEGTVTGTIAFTIGDTDNDPALLAVSATSSDPLVVPAGAITLGGSGTDRTIQLSPPAEAFGATTITITVDDGTASVTEIFVLTVNGINDAPVNYVPGAQTIAEDGNLFFTSTVSVYDVDATTLQVTLTVTGGAATLSTTDSLTFTAGDGTLDATMTFSGGQAALGAALTNLRFSPFANFNGAASLAMTTSDLGETGSGGTLTDSDTIPITVTAVNDAPVNTVPGAQTVANSTTLVFSVANGNQIRVSDVDAGTGVVRVTVSASGGTLTLASTTGLAFTTGDGVADATMTFDGTLTNVNFALDGLGYAAGAAGAGSVTITVNDLGLTGGAPQTDTDAVSITKT